MHTFIAAEAVVATPRTWLGRTTEVASEDPLPCLRAAANLGLEEGVVQELKARKAELLRELCRILRLAERPPAALTGAT